MTEQIFLGSQDNLKMTVAHICGTSATFTGDKKVISGSILNALFQNLGVHLPRIQMQQLIHYATNTCIM